jgi:hypothetical protein
VHSLNVNVSFCAQANLYIYTREETKEKDEEKRRTPKKEKSKGEEEDGRKIR